MRVCVCVWRMHSEHMCACTRSRDSACAHRVAARSCRAPARSRCSVASGARTHSASTGQWRGGGCWGMCDSRTARMTGSRFMCTRSVSSTRSRPGWLGLSCLHRCVGVAWVCWCGYSVCSVCLNKCARAGYTERSRRANPGDVFARYTRTLTHACTDAAASSAAARRQRA
jgi:hypothetical protein